MFSYSLAAMKTLRNIIKDKATEAFTDTATTAVKRKFFDNIMGNDLVAVERALKKYKDIATWRSPIHDHPPLFHAHFHGHSDMMKLLLTYGMKVDEKYEGQSLLHITPHNSCFKETVDAWLAQKLDINTRDTDGNTLLILMARHETPEQLSYLLDHGADIDAENKEGETAFMYAAKSGNNDNLSLLATRGANINQANAAGSSPLMTALKKNLDETAEHLLSLGVDTQGYYGGYALIIATIAAQREEDTEIIRKLITHGIDVNSTTTPEHGRMTALMYAAAHLSEPAIQCLLDVGADSCMVDTSGMTAFDHYKKNAPRNIGDILADKMNEQMPSALAQHKKAIVSATQSGATEKIALIPRIKLK